MKKLMKCILVCAATVLISGQSVSHAEGRVKETIGGVTETGIISHTSTVKNGEGEVKETVLFNSYDTPGTTTAYYNDADGTSTASGWVDTRDFNNDMVLHVDLDTLASTGLDITLEGLLSDDISTPMLLKTWSFSTTNTGLGFTVGTSTKYFRVGQQSTGTKGTDSCTIKLRAEGER